jgi:hypothetical protein
MHYEILELQQRGRQMLTQQSEAKQRKAKQRKLTVVRNATRGARYLRTTFQFTLFSSPQNFCKPVSGLSARKMGTKRREASAPLTYFCNTVSVINKWEQSAV